MSYLIDKDTDTYLKFTKIELEKYGIDTKINQAKGCLATFLNISEEVCILDEQKLI